MRLNLTRLSLITPCLLFVSLLFAQRGKDGPRTVAAANTIVNEYTAITANVTAGSTNITVAASSLNANGRFSAALAPGDLVMIYQVQGATINGTPWGLPKDSTWGRLLNYYTCGRYEFAQVRAVPNATTITLDCGLTYDYNTGTNFRSMVVRVPRFTTLTVNSGGVLTCDDWNGTTGGVVAVEVDGNATINTGGSVDATGKGFRGGSTVGDNQTTFGVNDVANTNPQIGAEKGEGIVGYQSDYDAWGGRYGRGAAGNAGGGGAAHNAGGGGGANAAQNIYNYKAYGIPDLSVAGYTNAWNLDNAAIVGYNNTNSAGGGRGGYSFSSSNQNAASVGPSNGAWGGDNRNVDACGFGGRPLDYSTGRIFFGGGGGAGDGNQGAGGAGGDGGGLIYLLAYGNIAGSGTFVSNGNNGSNAAGGTGFPSGLDAAGGGGAGGTIIVNAVGTVSNTFTMNANGANGGNQVISPTFGNTETEGPGGGGGGGYIAVSSGTPTRNTNGGNNGTTNSSALSEFPPNGALKGCAGVNNAGITNFTINAGNGSACFGSSASLTATISGTAPSGATITWWDAQTGGNVVGTGSPFTTPTLTATTTYYVGVCPGTYRIPVVVTINPLPTVTITATSPVCSTTPAFNLSASPAGGTWSGTGITNAANGTFNPSTAGTGTFTITYSYTDANGCTNTDTEQQIVNAGGSATINAVGSVCANASAFNLSATPAGGTWSGTGITNTTNGTFDPSVSGAGTFTVTYTIAGACAATDQETVTVNSVPNSSITPVSAVCSNAAAFNLSAATAGGTWSGTGITSAVNGTFDPSVSGAGNFVVTYSIGGACPSSSTTTVTVNAVQNATINATTPVCTGDAAFNLSAATAGGTWSGTGITNSTNGTFDPSVSGAGTFTITYTLGGACPASDQETVTVNSVPNSSITPVSAVCSNAASFNLSAATAGGTWSGTGITSAINGTFDPSVSGVGTFTVTYSIGGACPSSSSTTVTVNAVQNATINATTPVCTGDAAFNLSAATAGGTWSGTGITNTTNGTFDPSVSGAGTFTVTYSLGGACPSSDQETVTVNQQANATITSPGAFCASSPAVNLTAAQSGGTWAGTGITNASNGTFDPSVSGTGTFAVVYTIGGSCPDDDTLQIVVDNFLDATITSVPAQCSNSSAFNLSAVTSGGVWSGTGITNSSSGTFDPSVSGAGTFTVTYSISGSCGSTDTAVVTVNNAADATITPVSSVCVTAPAFNLSSAQSGGTWSGTGITDSNLGTFDPAVSGTGTFAVVYTIGGACPDDDTIQVAVNNTLDATIDAVSPLCSGSAPFNMTAATSGGVWSGTGISDTTNGTFNPFLSGAGTFTVTYSIAGNCGNTDTTLVTIVSAADATITSVPPMCSSSSSFTFSASQSGGVWNGTGITDTVNGIFDPAVSGVGTFTVIYTISGMCGDSDTTSVVVDPVANATINSAAPVCADAAAFNLTAADGGGVWSGTGISDSITGMFDPPLSGAGTFTVTYSIGGNCGDSDTALVVIQPLANATITAPGTICISNGAVTLSAAQSGGMWNGTGITNTSNGTFDPSVSGAGTFQVIYTISSSCPDADTINVTVVNSVSANINAAGPFCSDDAATTLTAANSGGVWTGTGITDSLAGIFDPSSSGAGTFNVIYTISGNCSAADTATIIVNATADATITSTPSSLCSNGAAVTLNAVQSGGTWSGSGVNAGSGVFNPVVSGGGTFQIVYTISGACGDADTIAVTVNAAPNAAASVDQQSGCAPLCVSFNSGTASTYQWSLGDGATDTIQSPSYCYNQAGTYTATVIVSSNNCSDTGTVVITANQQANASFTAPTLVPPGTTVDFTSNSTGNFANYWDFGNSFSTIDTSFSQNPSYTYTDTGYYCVTLIALNANGCNDTAVNCILVVDDAVIEVPNIFTPNGDLTNEFFSIKSTGLKELNCVIFDRWGIKMAEFNGVNGFWDGRAGNNKKAPDGTYFYILKYTALNDKEGEAKGYLQLISD